MPIDEEAFVCYAESTAYSDASSFTTVVGPGSRSGKMVRAVGESVQSLAINLAIKSRLYSIKSLLGKKSSLLLDLQPLRTTCKDLLELARDGYSVSTRRSALSLLRELLRSHAGSEAEPLVLDIVVEHKFLPIVLKCLHSEDDKVAATARQAINYFLAVIARTANLKLLCQFLLDWTNTRIASHNAGEALVKREHLCETLQRVSRLEWGLLSTQDPLTGRLFELLVHASGPADVAPLMHCLAFRFFASLGSVDTSFQSALSEAEVIKEFVYTLTSRRHAYRLLLPGVLDAMVALSREPWGRRLLAERGACVGLVSLLEDDMYMQSAFHVLENITDGDDVCQRALLIANAPNALKEYRRGLDPDDNDDDSTFESQRSVDATCLLPKTPARPPRPPYNPFLDSFVFDDDDMVASPIQMPAPLPPRRPHVSWQGSPPPRSPLSPMGRRAISYAPRSYTIPPVVLPTRPYYPERNPSGLVLEPLSASFDYVPEPYSAPRPFTIDYGPTKPRRPLPPLPISPPGTIRPPLPHMPGLSPTSPTPSSSFHNLATLPRRPLPTPALHHQVDRQRPFSTPSTHQTPRPIRRWSAAPF